jgi:geranylgeranyl reductase family protein
MMNLKTDILVVGGGPAGSTLAKQLALAGREVTLMDRASFPRHKACGGGLSRHTLQALDLDISPVTEVAVKQLMVDGAWSGRIRFPVEKKCQVVSRWDFDAFLLKSAVSSGAQLLENTALQAVVRVADGFQVTSSAGQIQANILCACDGASSKTARALGFPANQNQVVALEALAVLKPDSAAEIRDNALFNFAFIRNGYAWSFPRQSELAIGVCSADAIGRQVLQAHLHKFVSSCKDLQDLQIHSIKGGQLPVFRTARAVYAEHGAYLVGDAAGFVDAFSLEGIHYAVKSGRFAADAILGDGEVQYEAAVRQAIVPELELAHKWAKLVFSTPLWMFGSIMSTPIYRHYLSYFVDIFSGALTYREMLEETKWMAKILPHI